MPNRTSAPMLVDSAAPVTPMLAVAGHGIEESAAPPPRRARSSCPQPPRGPMSRNSTRKEGHLLF